MEQSAIFMEIKITSYWNVKMFYVKMFLYLALNLTNVSNAFTSRITKIQSAIHARYILFGKIFKFYLTKNL